MSFILQNNDMQKICCGCHTTVTASDLVDTGLSKVYYVIASLASDPILACAAVTISIPDQVANPGKITIKTWMPTDNTLTTPVAATTFGKEVCWQAIGR